MSNAFYAQSESDFKKCVVGGTITMVGIDAIDGTIQPYYGVVIGVSVKDGSTKNRWRIELKADEWPK